MKDSRTLQQKITDILTTELGVEEKDITPEAHLVDDLGADSLDLGTIGMAVEQDFGLDVIPDDDMEKWRTVGDVIDYLRKRTGAPSAEDLDAVAEEERVREATK